MTDPNDDLSSVADAGSIFQDGDSDRNDPADSQEGGPGVPGEAADSPAAQGAPVGPPD